ncbi:MAG TPA: DUF262 domain-containing protein [Planctomycetaceae bacterium]|jgi:hypothetical protein|nr:DUF262 domain-containing protein [Planctomycetaceae bacterium]
MDQFRTERAVYMTIDFIDWNKSRRLEITPKFQRRPVWKTPAKSFFIDTLLRGMTVPPIYFRLRQNTATTKPIQEVVDGQQRIRTVLEFCNGDFAIAENLEDAPWAGKVFSELTTDQQNQIMRYGFPCETFKGISDPQIFEVFCRLNMNGVKLSRQELRNGRFFGRFKQQSFKIAFQYIEFWRHHKIFSEQAMARMLEVELVSECLIAGMSGMQDKKKSIDEFYRKYDSTYPSERKDERRLHDVMDAISQTFDVEIAKGAFRRPPLFYSLYCAVYHRMFGLPNAARVSPRRKLAADDRQSLRSAVLKLSGVIKGTKDPGFSAPKKYVAFVAACQRQTDNLTPRKDRFGALYDEAF